MNWIKWNKHLDENFESELMVAFAIPDILSHTIFLDMYQKKNTETFTQFLLP